jgi:hypothetical protein
VPLLDFGDHPRPRVGCGSISRLADGLRLGAEALLAQLCVGVGYRIGGQLIGDT